jgi:hypothetical protein
MPDWCASWPRSITPCTRREPIRGFRARPRCRRNALPPLTFSAPRRRALDAEEESRQLTPEEERRLAETPLDYSDIPPLFGEDWITALLLAMVIEHCAGYSPEARRRMTSFLSPDPSSDQWLDSYNIPANAEAMQELHGGGEIEITEQDGNHIVAKVTPEGRALLDRLRADRERDCAAKS